MSNLLYVYLSALSNGIPSCLGGWIHLEKHIKISNVITYGKLNDTALGTPKLVNTLLVDKAVKIAKHIEANEIHSIFQAPAIIIANAKNPYP